jgi:hypothetical protein
VRGGEGKGGEREEGRGRGGEGIGPPNVEDALTPPRPAGRKLIYHRRRPVTRCYFRKERSDIKGLLSFHAFVRPKIM